MEINNGVVWLWAGCLLVLLKDASGSFPEMSIHIAPSPSHIYIGEKTFITAKIDFGPDTHYKDIKVVFYPSVDDPDFVVTRVTQVKIGKNLKITGDENPIMDFGRKSLQIPGEARSCQFNLGDVTSVGTSAAPDSNTITMKFEAIVLEDRDEDVGPGHEHQIVLSMQIDENSMIMCMETATFQTRPNPLSSMPLLFKSWLKNYKSSKVVTEMKME